VVGLAERDYKYGRGRLVLRVTHLHLESGAWFDGEWMWLDGVEVRWDGTDGPPRRVLVRVRALGAR
jgi:hypothetical protein